MSYPLQWNPPGGGPAGDPFAGGYQVPPAGNDPFANPYQSPPGGAPYGSPHQNPTGWAGYGQAPPPGPPPPPKRDNTQWVILTIAVVAIVTVVAGGLLWRLNDGGSDTTASTATSTTTSVTPTTTPTTTRTTSTPAPQVPPPAPAGGCKGFTGGPGPQTPPSWSTVVSPRGMLYDVPPGWTVEKCGTLIGWEKKCPETPDSPFGVCPIRTMSGAATLANPQCPKSSLAMTGVPGAKNTEDINVAVQDESQLVADIYTSDSGVVPQVSLSPPRNLTVAGAPAVEIIATVTGIEADNCTGPRALHAMVAFKVPGQPGSVLFVVSMDQDLAGAPDAGLIDQMVSSLRSAQPA